MKILKIPSSYIFILIVLLFFIKVFFYFSVRNNLLNMPLGGSNDSDYYHEYAIGYIDVAVNSWPVILRFFNNYGLYSRNFFSYLLLFLNLFIIPFLTAMLSNLSFKYDQKQFLYCVLLCFVYPTLFFYTLDIYRDVFMVFSFLIGCLVVKKSLHSSRFTSFAFLYILAIIIALFLFTLRPYLGGAFLMALFLWRIKLTKIRLLFFGILYFLILFIANYMGFLDPLTTYRTGFEYGPQSGSTLGLDFSNPVTFLPNFILSTIGQLLGLYLINFFAILLFFVETIPFIWMLIYIVKNIRYTDSFVRFLILFFILYASVWLIGNDNLGTAVRLRIYNYFVVYICFFYIFKLKNNRKLVGNHH